MSINPLTCKGLISWNQSLITLLPFSLYNLLMMPYL